MKPKRKVDSLIAELGVRPQKPLMPATPLGEPIPIAPGEEEGAKVEEEPPILDILNDDVAERTLSNASHLQFTTFIQRIRSSKPWSVQRICFVKAVNWLERERRWEEALQLLRRGPELLGRKISEFCLYRQGKILLSLDRIEEAEAYLVTGISQKRNQSPRIYSLLIDIYRQLGEEGKVRIFSKLKRDLSKILSR